METTDTLEILSAHPFLRDMAGAHLEKLAPLAAEVRFARDQIIFRVGDESSLFYLLFEGKVALEVPAPGRTICIATLGAGDEMGWSSLLSPLRKHFQVRSLEPVRAYAFDGARLKAACDQDCSFGYELMRRILAVVAARLQATRIQLLDVYAPKQGAKA